MRTKPLAVLVRDLYHLPSFFRQLPQHSSRDQARDPRMEVNGVLSSWLTVRYELALHPVDLSALVCFQSALGNRQGYVRVRTSDTLAIT